MTEIVVALIGQSAVLVALIESVRRRAGRAEKRATEASRQTVPTGNGFATHVREALGRIEREQRELGRDIGGIREELRDDRAAARALAGRITRLETQHGKARQEPHHLDP